MKNAGVEWSQLTS